MCVYIYVYIGPICLKCNYCPWVCYLPPLDCEVMERGIFGNLEKVLNNQPHGISTGNFNQVVVFFSSLPISCVYLGEFRTEFVVIKFVLYV